VGGLPYLCKNRTSSISAGLLAVGAGIFFVMDPILKINKLNGYQS